MLARSRSIIRRADGRERRRVTVYLPPLLAKKLKLYSTAHEAEMSEIVSAAVEEFLSEPG